MSGSPQGSSPRLSGVIHFLKMVEKDGYGEVPKEVSPAARWTLHTGSSFTYHSLVDHSDLNEKIKALVASMVFENILNVSNWADCTNFHLDVKYTDSEGNGYKVCYGGCLDLYVDEEDGFHPGVHIENCPYNGKQLSNLLDHLWSKEDDC